MSKDIEAPALMDLTTTTKINKDMGDIIIIEQMLGQGTPAKGIRIQVARDKAIGQCKGQTLL